MRGSGLDAIPYPVRLVGRKAISALTMETASRIPATPPAAESSRLSVINWRTMRARLDPMARRMAISFCRAAARAVSKLARFAQAMSKHERRHADENQQRLLIRATQTRVALRTRHNLQPHAQEVGLVERRRVAERGHRHFRFDDLVKQRLQPGLGLRDGFTGLEASENVDPALAAIPHVGETRAHAGSHGHGHEHLRRETRLGSIEARLRHADDGQRIVVHQDAPPNDGRIARKSRLPICVAQNRIGMFARAQIVLRREEPSGGAVDSEQAGNSCPRPVLRLQLRSARRSSA